MKMKHFVYGIFALALGFAAVMGYLYHSSSDGPAGPSGFDPVAAGNSAGAALGGGGRAVSGQGGRLLIAYAGDILGSMDPCGCTEPPTGGLPRRLTVLRDYRATHRDAPMLVLETGNAFHHSNEMDDPTNRHIVEAFDLLGMHAVNTGAGDLRRLNRLVEMGWDTSRVSAAYLFSTAEPPPSGRFPVKPWTVQAVRAEEGGGEVKVGILALGAASGGAGEKADAGQALRRFLPEVEPLSDMVVLLSWLKDEELLGIAKQFPGIDVILNGTSTGEGREFPRTGNTVIVESARKGTGLSMLDLRFDSTGRVNQYTNQVIPLVPVVADAARLTEYSRQARREYVAWKEVVARRQPPVTEARLYLGSAACKECHEKAFQAWERSRHARAIDSLKQGANQFNDACLSCHVTAFEAERGFVDMIRTPGLAGVHCESCHGSAADHARNPESVHPGLGAFQQVRWKVKPQFCLRCHDAANSPKFNYEAYWKKIAH